MVSMLVIPLEIHGLPQMLYVLGRRHRSFLRLWFSLGALVAMGTCAIAAVVLIHDLALLIPSVSHVVSFRQQLNESEHAKPLGPQPVIQAVIPGVTMPLLKSICWICGATFAVVMHEVGHGLAASVEGVRIEHMGMVLFGVFPGAYVQLDAEAMSLLPASRAIRIYSAGVWFNLVLVAACMGSVLVLPVLLSPLYHTGRGVSVVSVASADAPLPAGTSIQYVGGCRTSSLREWQECGARLLPHLLVNQGYCVPASMLTHPLAAPCGSLVSSSNNTLSTSTASTTGTSVARLTFAPDSAASFLTNSANHSCPATADAPSQSCFESSPHPTTLRAAPGACLPAAQVAHGRRCAWTGASEQVGDVCPRAEKEDEEECVRPVLEAGHVFLALDVRLAGQVKKAVYIGPPDGLFQTLGVSGYVPRIDATGWGGSWVGGMPGSLQDGLVFTAYASAALALTNAAPVRLLDGEPMLRSCVDILFPRSRVHKRRYFTTACLNIGSLLFLLVVARALMHAAHA